MSLSVQDIRFLRMWAPDMTAADLAKRMNRPQEIIEAEAARLNIQLMQPKPPKAKRVRVRKPRPKRPEVVRVKREPAKRRTWKRWTEDQLITLQLMYKTHTNDEIGVVIDRPRHCIEAKAKQLGLKKPKGFISMHNRTTATVVVKSGALVATLREASGLLRAGNADKALMVINRAIEAQVGAA